MTTFAYLFEARSLQKYILDSGRMGDMVGASELVDALCRELIDDVIESVGSPVPEFSRRASGAFLALFDSRSAAERWRDLWSILMPQYLPGLEFVHCIHSGPSAMAAATGGYKMLAHLRNRRTPSLPEAGPFVRRSPRTGRPAVGVDRTPNGPEWVDAATSVIRSANRGGRARQALVEKFLGDKASHYRFPSNLEEEFPFASDNRYVAVVHIDGSGLGQCLLRVAESLRADPSAYAERYLGFSEAIARAAQIAAQQATNTLLDHAEGGFLPIRPLVLGGDDLTVIVRGDLAFNFTETFQVAFEKESEIQLSALGKTIPDLPAKLSSGAGLVFIKINQPFYMAYALAEELASVTKKHVGTTSFGTLPRPSTLMFHRVTSSQVDDYDVIEERELSYARSGGHGRGVLSLGTYAVSDISDLPSIGALRALKDILVLPELSRGPLRRVLTLLRQSPYETERAYRRWRDNAERKPTLGEKATIDEFDHAMTRLGVIDPNKTFHRPDGRSPLGDAIAWLSIEGAVRG